MNNDNLNTKVLNSFTEKDRKCLTKADLNRLTYNRRDDVEYSINDKPLSEVVEFLSKKADEISNKNAKFYAEYDYDGCIEVEIRYAHTETDEEYAKRLQCKIDWCKQQKKRVADTNKNKAKNEKAQLKKLIKKYGVPK